MEIKNKSIALIIPYFGKWPSYFNIFLKGCENNNWLNIIFFTDCPFPEKKYENLTFIKSSLKEFSTLSTQKLGIPISIQFSYKLCDFKPCYGLIFEDYLKDYDYWGYGDIDLIYGDLASFISPKIHAKYDVISNREEILSGSLSLFKNKPSVNLLFKNSEYFAELLMTDKYEGLDETAHNHSTWKGASKLDLPKHCLTYIVFREGKKGTLKVSFESTCEEFVGPNDFVMFEQDRLTFNGKAISYFHYVCNKNREEFKFPKWETIPEKFYIKETGFYLNSANLWNSLVHLQRKTLGFVKNITLRILKRLKIWH